MAPWWVGVRPGGYPLRVPPDNCEGVTLDRVTGPEPRFPQGAVGEPQERPELDDGVERRDMPVGVVPHRPRNGP